jgi:uncharacterized Zn-finger protein
MPFGCCENGRRIEISPQGLWRTANQERGLWRILRAAAAVCIYTFEPNTIMVRARKTASQEHDMAGHSIPHFQNDGGHSTIEIGVKEFMCVGASVPYDHPHVYLDMGDDNEKVCPYCSTLFRYNPALKASQTDPAGCTFTNQVAA